MRALSPGEKTAPDAGSTGRIVAPIASRLGLSLDTFSVHLRGDGALGDSLGYTIGRDVFLGFDSNSLATPEGLQTLAHELVHVKQQRHAGPDAAGRNVESEGVESEADDLASQVLTGGLVNVQASASPTTIHHKKKKPAPSTGLSNAEVASVLTWYSTRTPLYTKSVIKQIQGKVGTDDDGVLGPFAVRAIARWQGANGLDADGVAGAITLTAMFGKDIRDQAPSPGGGEQEAVDSDLTRPHGLTQIKKVFGSPGKNIGTFAMRCGADGAMKNVPAHKKVGPLFQAVFEDIWNAGLASHINSYDGCYVYRTKRGGSSNFSTHAWGIAMDVNASANPMRKKSDMIISKDQKVIAPYFEKHGFYWGAAFGDPMHFQYCTGY
jgi:D-alanyl-D-alanine carboxypeptidase/Domain of unknown function (DUF4157)/Putative peptidoglycan binding domain